MHSVLFRMAGKSISRDCPIYSCIHSNNQELLCLELNLEFFFFFFYHSALVEFIHYIYVDRVVFTYQFNDPFFLAKVSCSCLSRVSQIITLSKPQVAFKGTKVQTIDPPISAQTHDLLKMEAIELGYQCCHLGIEIKLSYNLQRILIISSELWSFETL